MTYDKPIIIQKLNEDTQEFEDRWKLHANVRYTQGSEYSDAGAQRSTQTMNFIVRAFKDLKEIKRNTQIYQIIFEDSTFSIEEYEPYDNNKSVRLQAASYG